jgi:hypothetical protein
MATIRHRLHRMERVTGERQWDAMQRVVSEQFDRDDAHRRDVTAALSSPDPERRAWAAKEMEQIAALDAMSDDEFVEAVMPKFEAACLATGVFGFST